MVVSCLNRQMGEELQNRLAVNGFEVFRFDGTTVVDRESLFASAVQQLPMGDASRHPEVDWCHPHNWDSFADFVSQGIYELRSDKVAIIWNAAEQLSQRNLAVLVESVQVFEAIQAKMLEASELSREDRTTLRVFLLGDGIPYPAELPMILY